MYKIYHTLLALLLSSMTLTTPAICAECDTKIEVAPVFLHIDILESGKTIKRMDMPGVRGEFSYRFWKGFYIKPTVLYAHGGAAKGGTMSGSVFIGHCFPVTEKLVISPAVGITYSHLWTKVNFMHLQNLKENFKSSAPTVSVDVHYTCAPGFRISGCIQYAWSRTHTSIPHILKSKGNCKGFNYSVLLEKDLSDHWSVNLGAAYSLSLSKEKHGIRGTGVKAGLAYWF